MAFKAMTGADATPSRPNATFPSAAVMDLKSITGADATPARSGASLANMAMLAVGTPPPPARVLPCRQRLPSHLLRHRPHVRLLLLQFRPDRSLLCRHVRGIHLRRHAVPVGIEHQLPLGGQPDLGGEREFLRAELFRNVHRSFPEMCSI